MTPHYQTDDITVYAGDCLDMLPLLADNSIDAVVTDPPYNLSFMAKPWDALEGREDAGFAYWLSGLIDGEGHFYVKAHSRGTHAPGFSLKMRADELGTLECIRRTMKIGSITREDREPNPMVRWNVQDKAGCQALVDLLDKYSLRAKKLIDYWTWREAVCEWVSRPRGNRWHGASSNERMAALRERLMSTRVYAEIPWSGNEFQDWCRLWATECLRVLKPGGHMLAFGGTRTFHRLACGVEDAGFEIRDSIAWIYGSGFPKSLDVSKAIDKSAGASREVIGKKGGRYAYGFTDAARDHFRGMSDDATGFTGDPDLIGAITAPATDAAKQWQGWGTALKPAHEPIVVARKPLQGSVAANVQVYGTGAFNIDGCRIHSAGSEAQRYTVKRLKPGSELNRTGGKWRPESDGAPKYHGHTKDGRWPTNVVFDESRAAELDRQSGVSSGRVGMTQHGSGTNTVYGKYNRSEQSTIIDGTPDSGGASRFFPVFKYQAKAPAAERPSVDGTTHPTCKPLDLMRWLVRLVTPPGGVVLDPFAGTGTTGEAAIHEHKHAILIEREPDYLPLIVARLDKPRQVGFDFEHQHVVPDTPGDPNP